MPSARSTTLHESEYNQREWPPFYFSAYKWSKFGEYYIVSWVTTLSLPVSVYFIISALLVAAPALTM